MNNITPGFGRDWTLSYIRDDGQPGLIDLINSTTKITVVPDGFADITVGPFDPTTGKMVIGVDHNGSIADITVTIENDGDLGAGMVPISISQTFSMLINNTVFVGRISRGVGPLRPTA